MGQVMDLNDNQANVAFTFAKDRCVEKSIALSHPSHCWGFPQWMSHD